MKLKTLLKFSLPILAITGLAVSLPLALTSCSNKNKEEIVKTTNQNIQNVRSKLNSLPISKIDGKDFVVKNTDLYGSVLSALNLKSSEVVNVNYIKQVKPDSSKLTLKANSLDDKPKTSTTNTPTQTQILNYWDIQITLSPKYDWSKLSSSKDFVINGKTLTIKNVQTRFANIAINKEDLMNSTKEVSSALQEIKNLANFKDNPSSLSILQSEFLTNFVSKVHNIPKLALNIKISQQNPQNNKSTLIDKKATKEDLNLSLSNYKLSLEFTPNSNFVFYSKNANDQSNQSVNIKNIYYQFVDLGSIGTSIASFIKTNDVHLNRNGSKHILKVMDNNKEMIIPVTYNVLNPEFDHTTLGNNGTYVTEYVFDLGNLNYDSNSMLKNIQANLGSLISSKGLKTEKIANVQYNQKSRQLKLQVLTDVSNITYETMKTVIKYLSEFDQQQISQKNANWQNGLLQTLGLTDLTQPETQYINVKTQSNKETTSISIVLGQNASGELLTNATMPTFSKEFTKRISENPTLSNNDIIGIKLTETLVNQKDNGKDLTIKLPTIEIQFKNKLLSNKPKTNLSLQNNVEKFGKWLSKINESKIKVDELSPIIKNSSKQNQLIGVVLKNSKLYKEISSHLGIDSTNIYQIRFVVNNHSKSKEFNLEVILKSGINLENNLKQGLLTSKDDKVQVNLSVQKTFSQTNDDTLVFSLVNNK